MGLRTWGGDRASVVARATLFIVLGLVLANLLFNAIANASGIGYPYASFLFQPADRFADFFKLAFSYPGAPIHRAASFWGANDLLVHHMADVKRFEGTNVNHFHVPPFPTLLALCVRRLIVWVDPVLLFLGLLGCALAALFATVLRVAPAGRPGAALATASILSYPALLIMDRGHFYSLICATLTIAASLRTLRGRIDLWTILMFAIAVNIKPNAGVIPLALFLGRPGATLKSLFLLGIASALLFLGSLAAVHQIYPAYTFATFLKGLGQYGMAYAGGDIGYPNGSSLYGMLRAPLGYAAWMVYPPLCLGALLLAPAILESRQGRLRQSECLFLVLAVYVFASHIFADYHLLVFIIPLIVVACEEGPMDWNAWGIVLASSLMLAPKNFVFEKYDGVAWSWQVIGNPLILLIASAIVLWGAWRRNEVAKAQRVIEVTAAA